MNFKFPVEALSRLETPLYYYDMDILNNTLDTVKNEADKYGFKVHYAVKANANERILKAIQQRGFGADCVSGFEVQQAVDCGFDASYNFV